jgi:hypothetical protein
MLYRSASLHLQCQFARSVSLSAQPAGRRARCQTAGFLASQSSCAWDRQSTLEQRQRIGEHGILEQCSNFQGKRKQVQVAIATYHGLAVVQPMQHISRETVPKKAIRTTPMPTPNRRTPGCSSKASAKEASKASAKHSCSKARVTERCSLIMSAHR